jgi:hypothetical protein
MKHIAEIPSKQTALFSERDVDISWEKTDMVKRFYVNIPMYPFRTLSHRDTHMLLPTGKNQDFDIASPLFPANTQINIQLKKRNNRNFLRYMIPFQLDYSFGSSKNALTAEEKKTATMFSIKQTNAAKVDFVITRVDIDVKDMYLQVCSTKQKISHNSMKFFLKVCRLKYKGITPERPLSNVFTSYRTIFTPLQKVSLHQYDLTWDSTIRPNAVYITFIR